MLSIRKATKEDAGAVWKLRNAAILNQCIGHYPADALKIWTAGELSEDFITDVGNRFYVAVHNNQIVGTGLIDIDAGKLDAVFVHPAHMRNGIGKKIVHHLEDIAMQHGLKTLSLESTLNAAPFYRACGYEGNEVGKYYSPRGIALDCVPMVKHFSPNNSSHKARPKHVTPEN